MTSFEYLFLITHSPISCIPVQLSASQRKTGSVSTDDDDRLARAGASASYVGLNGRVDGVDMKIPRACMYPTDRIEGKNQPIAQ